MASADVLIVDCSANLEDGRRVLQGLVRSGDSTEEFSSDHLVTFGWRLTNKYFSVDLKVSAVGISELTKPWMDKVDVGKAEALIFLVNLADVPSASKLPDAGAYLRDIKAFYHEAMLQRHSPPEVVMCVGLSAEGSNDQEDEDLLSTIESHFQAGDQGASEASGGAMENWFVEVLRVCMGDESRDLSLWEEHGEGLSRVRGALDTVNWPNLKPHDQSPEAPRPSQALDDSQQSTLATEDQNPEVSSSENSEPSHLLEDGGGGGDEPAELQMFEKMFQQVMSVREDSQHLGDTERRQRASDMVMKLMKEFMLDEENDDQDGAGTDEQIE